MKAYEKLLEPITIGTHQWRNRMVKAPSSAMSWDPGQFCNERIIGPVSYTHLTLPTNSRV